MTALLHLDSSSSPHSVSRELGALFARTWREHHTGPYAYRDLVQDPVPLVEPAFVDLGERVERNGFLPPAKVAALIETAAEQAAWDRTRPLIDQVTAADLLLLDVPMYNYSIPAALKAWIDRITFPGAFIDPDSGERILRDTRVVVLAARGGGYGPSDSRAGFDFQIPYLRAYFRNLGIAESNLTVVAVDYTRAGDIPGMAVFQDRTRRLQSLARERVMQLAAG
ncbi:MAG TPA: NAD(P)H-dependent oxidoreductase [Mycobacteriales bacterium]|nr:NAD(P)H-dependent oxidoreductase [Mycobacteriales bacterium]